MSTFGPEDTEARMVAEEFGVSVEQVRRDHLISHVLAALSASLAERVIFFGGTALARTDLPSGRLSEDIDLIATGPRRDVAFDVEATLDRALRRSHGRVIWAPSLTGVRDTDAGVLTVDNGRLALRMQLLTASGYPAWPTAQRQLHQRYSDASPANLRVPTTASFVAWKTVAWFDRHAPRDLWDLWALARQDAITAGAAELFSAHGPTGNPPQAWMFTSQPSEADWASQLAGQTRLNVGAAEALHVVADAWARAVAQHS